ncbi:MAG TPA: iron chelate uptake ABC transporter family permease subunit [Firmicutes bacterium]|jgi:iron complex transport system permease protein|nr:iron chelate uptake ABC transporter family permease subunit [Bacillota bacterium]
MSDRRKLVLLFFAVLGFVVLYLGVGLDHAIVAYALPRRLSKVLAIVLTGGAIGFSTTVFQTVTANRILTPSIMGLDSLYLLNQTLVLFFLGSTSILLVNSQLNFFFTVMTMVLFSGLLFRLLFRGEKREVYFLLLVGVIAGTLFQSVSSFLQMVLDPNEFLVVQNSMFASFNNVKTNLLPWSSLLVGGGVLYTLRYVHVLDVLALGREQSLNLGVDYEHVVLRLLLVVSVLVASVTALVGPITFLGLLVANLAREMLRSFKHLHLLLVSSLLGVVTLVGGQFLVERVLNLASPVSVIINLVGGLYFVFLLLRGSYR